MKLSLLPHDNYMTYGLHTWERMLWFRICLLSRDLMYVVRTKNITICRQDWEICIHQPSYPLSPPPPPPPPPLEWCTIISFQCKNSTGNWKQQNYLTLSDRLKQYMQLTVIVYSNNGAFISCWYFESYICWCKVYREELSVFDYHSMVNCDFKAHTVSCHLSSSKHQFHWLLFICDTSFRIQYNG